MSKLTCLLLLIFFTSVSCEDESKNGINPPVEIEEGSWIKYSPLKWTHDGSPLTGSYCKVYSDGASSDLKKQCLEFAEKMFLEILNQFNFDFNDLRFPPENKSKVNVYIDTSHAVAYAYWGTIFITIKTPSIDTSRYRYLFKHELTHEFEFLIEEYWNLGTDLWFSESIAIYCGGGFNYIITVEDIEAWIKANENFPGKGNPIMIHKWEDFPAGADIDGYYQKVFDITMKYLLDPKGLNKSINDVLNVFQDIWNGNMFNDAFETNFGISLEAFEYEYYSRIKSYLSDL